MELDCQRQCVCMSVLKGCKLFSIYHSLWVNYKMHIPISSPDWHCSFFYQNQRGVLKTSWRYSDGDFQRESKFGIHVLSMITRPWKHLRNHREVWVVFRGINWTIWCLFMTSWMTEFLCAACYSIIMCKSATSPTLCNCFCIIHSPFYAGESPAHRMRCLILAAFISFKAFSLWQEKNLTVFYKWPSCHNRRTAALLN